MEEREERGRGGRERDTITWTCREIEV